MTDNANTENTENTETPEVDTSNQWFVGVQNHMIILGRPMPRALSRAQALNLAAWLVALADEEDEFGTLLEAVLNT